MPITKCLVAPEPQKNLSFNQPVEKLKYQALFPTILHKIVLKGKHMQSMQISKWFDIPLNWKNSLWMQKEFVISLLMNSKQQIHFHKFRMQIANSLS